MSKIHKHPSVLSMIFFIIGLYVSFVVSGIFEEKLYKTKYKDGEQEYKFSQSSIALFIISLLSLSISLIMLKTKSEPKKSPFKGNDKFFLGLFYMISRYSTEYSLRYLDFISKIIGKSCKSISIIIIYFLYNIPLIGDILKKIINQKEGTIHSHDNKSDFGKVIITTISIILFNYEDGAESSGNNKDFLKTLLLGYGMLTLSLFFDGLLALKEKLVSHVVHHDDGYEGYEDRLSWEYMKIFSGFTLFVCSGVLTYNYFFDAGFILDIKRILENHELFNNLIYYSILTCIGQVFLYQILEKWGPLTLSIITGIRKIISIALSIIIFGKTCSMLKAISLTLGATIIVWEVLEKTQKNKVKSK